MPYYLCLQKYNIDIDKQTSKASCCNRNLFRSIGFWFHTARGHARTVHSTPLCHIHIELLFCMYRGTFWQQTRLRSLRPLNIGLAMLGESHVFFWLVLLLPRCVMSVTSYHQLLYSSCICHYALNLKRISLLCVAFFTIFSVEALSPRCGQ